MLGPPVILPCSSAMPSSSFESGNAAFFLPAAAVAISANNGDSTLLTATVTGKGEEPMSASPKASNTTQETFSPLESHPQARVASSTECDQEAERQEAEGHHQQIQTQMQQEQQPPPHTAASSELMQVEEGSYSTASAAAPAFRPLLRPPPLRLAMPQRYPARSSRCNPRRAGQLRRPSGRGVRAADMRT